MQQTSETIRLQLIAESLETFHHTYAAEGIHLYNKSYGS